MPQFPGGASIVKVEAAGGGGTTLTSAAEPYNASGKHEAHMAGSNCCLDFEANAGHTAYAPVWKIAWKPVSEPFSENGFHQAGCQRKETGVPSIFMGFQRTQLNSA
ncbi:MAG: hypothetical protein ACLQVY_15415 [Limisphaerales bacterium]